MIHLVFGPQGAGKSTLARQLADQHRGLRFSIDDWMAELYGPDLPQPLDFGWIMARVQRCEQRIWALAADLASRGGVAVLDVGCMRAADRSRYAGLAHSAGLPLQRHFVTAPLPLRRARVLARNRAQGDTFAFVVSPAMFDAMEPRCEPPDAAELAACASVTSTAG